MMKIVKCILIVFFVFIILFVGIVIVVFIFFKDKIVVMVKEEINKSVKVEVDFLDVDLFLFKGFLYLVFSLKDFFVIGIEIFEGIKFLEGKFIDFKLDIMFVIKSSSLIKIKLVNFIELVINILVLEDG